jgi:hypothetical protein
MEEAKTSTDPAKLARALVKCADDPIRKVARGVSRGFHVYATCATHYANNLPQFRIHQLGDQPDNHLSEK